MLRELTIEDVETVSHVLAQRFFTWNEPIPSFSTRYPGRLESAVHAVFQTSGRTAVYPTLLDKAAALLYLMIKSHPFQNGNKRIALTTFLVFLDRNGKWMSCDTQQMYNFTVWVAQSPPELKDATIQGIKDFISKSLAGRV